jgi:hypothetical protein
MRRKAGAAVCFLRQTIERTQSSLKERERDGDLRQRVLGSLADLAEPRLDVIQRLRRSMAVRSTAEHCGPGKWRASRLQG